MDVIFGERLVNYILAFFYSLTSYSLASITYYGMKSNVNQWQLIVSKKSYLLAFFAFVFVTTITVAYQNIFDNYREAILWWRVGLISSISYICVRWSLYARKVLRITDYERL